jgi:hypothetical protein
VAAKTKRAFGGASGPDWAEIDANGRKNWDMKNRQETLREFFRLVKLKGNAAEPKIKDACAAAALITDDGVGVRAGHGDSFSFALDSKGGIGNRCVHLF